MDIARNKRKENVAEYILYLWQLEDLLRALQFSPEAVYSQLVQYRNVDPATQQELLVWYMELANLLVKEGKEPYGHLEHTLHLITDLDNLHRQLMSLPVGERYRELFMELSPDLPKLRQIVGMSETLSKEGISDIEICFRALYAVMLYRIKGDKKSVKIIEDVTASVSPVIAELAKIYRQVEIGEVDLFKNK